MNKIMFDVLCQIENDDRNIKEISKILFKPYSIVEEAYISLCNEAYISNGKITQRGKEYLKEHVVENAVILAAGVSSRFVPLCFEKPKGLLEVKGEVLIERQIRQLMEAGITKIYIVVGFMKEKFSYLEEKFGVKLIETMDYRIRNNHASVWAAKDVLGNTVISSSDLYFNKNIIFFARIYCYLYIIVLQ